MSEDLIRREDAYTVLSEYYHHRTVAQHKALREALDRVPSAEPSPENCWGCNCPKMVPSAEPEYEPVTAEDFAKIMSENTLYNFVTWHQEALTIMERQGFVICKKTI